MYLLDKEYLLLHSPFALHSHQIVSSEGIFSGAIVCEEGKIKKICKSTSEIPKNIPLYDYSKYVIMPGLIDCHVHVNEPGRTHWEGFASATQAAAAGGVTTLIDMPLNCSPVTTSKMNLETKLAELDNKLWVNCGFWGGVIPDSINDLDVLLQSGVFGAKVFLTHSGLDEFPNVSREHLERIMPIMAKHKLPLLVHAELESCIHTSNHQNDVKKYQNFLDSRPDRWELDAIKMMIELAGRYQCRVHIVHLSSAQALPLFEEAKKRRVPISTETCPHYLYLHAEQIPDGSTIHKCTPPIRNQINSESLWLGLKNRLIDFIASDHSPCDPALKKFETGDFNQAWGGISSLQLTLPIVWSQAKSHKLSLYDVYHLLSLQPARFLGLDHHKGEIKIGYDADLVIWDPESSWFIEANQLFMRHKISPYIQQTLKGKIHRTYLSGRICFDEGRVSEEAYGSILFKG